MTTSGGREVKESRCAEESREAANADVPDTPSGLIPGRMSEILRNNRMDAWWTGDPTFLGTESAGCVGMTFSDISEDEWQRYKRWKK